MDGIANSGLNDVSKGYLSLVKLPLVSVHSFSIHTSNNSGSCSQRPCTYLGIHPTKNSPVREERKAGNRLRAAKPDEIGAELKLLPFQYYIHYSAFSS